MKTLVALLVGLCSLVARAESVDEIPRLVAEAYDSQATLQDMTNEFRQRGIPEEQVAGIEGFLKNQGISLEAKLAPVKLGTKQISFGSSRLVWNDKLQVKTSAGRILKFDSSMPADKVYAQTFRALTGTETSAFNFVVPQARADVGQKVLDAASAAGWNVLMWGSEAVTTVAAGLYDGILGTVSMLVERLKTGFANGPHGHVTCNAHGEYVMDGLFKNYDKDAVYQAMKKVTEAKAKMRDPNSAASRALTDVGRRMFNDGTAKIEAWSTFFTFDKNKDVLVSKSFLQKFFRKSDIEKCNPDYNAKDVEAALKSPGKTDEEKIHYYNVHYTSDSGLSEERRSSFSNTQHPLRATH